MPKQEHFFKRATRGGQLLLHELHMIAQVLAKALAWLCPVGLLAAIGWFILTTTAYQRYVGGQWLWAQLYALLDGPGRQQIFVWPSGQTMAITSAQLLGLPLVQSSLAALKAKLWASLWAGLCAHAAAMLGVLAWLCQRGKAEGAPKYLKGDRLGEAREIKQALRQNGGPLGLTLGIEKLPLPKLAEAQHFLFHGTTGSGKSTAIKALLDLVWERGDRAIIYDKSCNLVEQFYRPGLDQLLNPLDERSVSWGLWAECQDKADFDNLAAALVPAPANAADPFWAHAARTVFATAAYRLGKGQGGSAQKILPLLRYLLAADIGELHQLLKGTEAEALMSEKTEKTAISIKSVLATYLKSLCYLQDGGSPFSIRQWVQNDSAPGHLFISSLGSKHETLRPLISAWLDIAVNALLGLAPDPKRRIWVVLDELASLQQVPYLAAALSESRKFGGCFIIGVQSYAQLAKAYGHEGAKEISSLLNTRFVFRSPDPEVAHWSAKNLGETLVEEAREGVSYGANSIRDGASIQRAERQRPVVSGSEIMRLEDLSCYVRLPGAHPIVKLHFPYIDRPSKNPPFMPRKFKEDSLRDEVKKLADGLAAMPCQAPAKPDYSASQAPPNADKAAQIRQEKNFKDKTQWLFAMEENGSL